MVENPMEMGSYFNLQMESKFVVMGLEVKVNPKVYMH